MSPAAVRFVRYGLCRCKGRSKNEWWLASGFRPGWGRRGSWGRPLLARFEVAFFAIGVCWPTAIHIEARGIAPGIENEEDWLANGQHQPIRFELNLAVGQNGAVLFCSRGDAPGYVKRGRWPLEEKAQLQNA